jgi:DNA modification methylase
MKIRNRIKELRHVKANELHPNSKNWRTHPKAQQDALKGILAEIGYADALLAREQADGSLVLVDGHLRAETTPEEEVPVLILDINEAESDKLLLSLDPLAALAETNATALDSLLREVDTGSEGLQEMYADMADAADLYKDDTKEIEEDEVPEPPADPITQPGDLWTLGNHRLLCGDSTRKEDVDRLMSGAKADMVFTDPPYGIDFQSNFRKKTPQFDEIANDKTILEIDKLLFENMKENTAAYVCTRWDVYPEWFQQFKEKFLIKNCIVWYKKGGGLGDLVNSFLPNHEFFIVAHKGAAPLRGKRNADVWDIKRDSFSKYQHPTQKPVAVPAEAMQNHSQHTDLVLDVFLGSGSTLIAAEQLNRTCYGMELSPQYCDVIVQRWETLTGQKAERQDADGKTRPTT